MTIKDIARACGVGVSTVSRVLNNRPDVSDEVRRKVLEEVERQGYIPNNSARDLVKTQSDAIGVVTRGIGNPFFSDLLKTISREIDRSGFNMVLRQITSDEDEVKAGAILEREKKLRGLIFLGGRYDYTSAELSLIGVPYVCCSYNNRFGTLNAEDYAYVSIDDYQTAHRAVSELIDRGHRQIAALLPSCTDRSISQIRYKGYCAALTDHGIEVNDALVEESGSFDMAAAYHSTRELLERNRDFTALFTVSDMMATAAMKALTDHGLRIPDDCSVIAIDGLNMSEYTIPTLTTMVQPTEKMGCEAVRILLEMIDGAAPRHLQLEATLRKGGSVRSI